MALFSFWTRKSIFKPLQSPYNNKYCLKPLARAGKEGGMLLKRGYGSLQSLLIEVIEDLSNNTNASEAILQALRKICAYFSFGCTFVYERDHKQTLHLKEHWASYKGAPLPPSFRFEEYLSPEQIELVTGSPVMFFHEHTQKSDLEERVCALFDANSLLIVPIVDDDGVLLGGVGMIDRRRTKSKSRTPRNERHSSGKVARKDEILMDEGDISMSHMLITLVANRVKLRVVQQRLYFTRTTMESILDNAGIDIYVNDFETHEILYANKSMAAPYGGLKNMLGKTCWQALYDDKTGECDYCPRGKIIDENGVPTKKVYSWDYQRPFDGAWFRVLSAAFRWVDGRMAHVISSVDITESKNNEFLVKKMAYYDTLTDIPNRRKLEEDFNAFAARTKNENVTLLIFDLDDFKEINDQYGHTVGDSLLIEVARRLQNDPVTKDKVYRYGGDEFILLFPDRTKKEIQEIGNHLLDLFKKPWTIDDAIISCRASIGFARYPDDAGTYQPLLDCADNAMYEAKNSGKGKVRGYKSYKKTLK